MSRASVLALGRVAATLGMIDVCTIRRETGQATDPNGFVTPIWTTIYSGPCRVQQMATEAREETPGQARVLLVRRELQLPVDSSGNVHADDVATIDSCVHDADLVDRVFVIRGEAAKTEATARRLGIDEVTS